MSVEDEDLPQRRDVPRVVKAVASVPWAITDEGMDQILAIVTRQNDVTVEALEAYRAQRLKDAESLSIDRGVAQIAVQGPLTRYSDFFTAVSGGTTYQGTMLDLERARVEPAVKAVLISFDSPGGEVNGVNELAAAIRAVAAVKPVYAYVGGTAASAAYWLASGASRIIVDQTAILGSIGVRLGLRDTSERDARSGVKTIEFVSSQSPHKKTDPHSEPGRAKLQATVDSLASVFVASVAKYRGFSEEDVIARFGGGGVKVGSDAVEAGMADAIGSFEGVKASLMAGHGARAKGHGDFRMDATQGNVTGRAPDTDPVYSQAALDAAVAKARSEGETIGATQAQQRISAILGSEQAKDRSTLANHLAFETTVSAEDAKKMLAVSAAVPAATATRADTGRARDAAGGLALADATERAGDATKPSTVAIDSQKIYANLNRPAGG